jgi:ubiquitin-protein ligase
MAEEIRNRRLHTEMENIKKIDSSKIQVEKKVGYLDNGIVLTITFNLKDHLYNPKLLTDQSELSLMAHEGEGEGDKKEETIQDDEEGFSDDEPVDECEDREYTFDLIVPKKFPFMFPELRAR